MREISMSIQENVQIVKDAFAAIGRGDTQGLLALCAKDIEWIIPGEWPLAGTHRGHAGLAEFLQKASESVETSISQPVEFVAQGDRVLVIGFSRGSFKATNKSFEDHFVFAITGRNGQMTNIREYVDTLALARASETAAAPGPLTTETISIIGSGGMAAAIGGRAAKAGHHVEVMNRETAKARALAEKIGHGATTGTFGAPPAGDIVILAVPYAVVLDVVKQYGQALAGKLLVDITNPINSDFTSFVTPEDSFGAQEIVKAAPADAVVIKAFNTQFSHVLAAGPVNGHPLDVFLAGDDVQAKVRVLAFIQSLGLRPLDAGRLPMAQTLEHLALLSLGLVAHSVKNTKFALGVSLLG
jgi:predicted dinucleotide-binding enzyme/ketosteroid isomerase-like protein